MLARREFVRRAGVAMLPMAFAGRGMQDTSRIQARPPSNAGGTVGDTLAIPVGRPSAPLWPLDNDPGVIAIEGRLRCNCGCTLDVYTCRTTDFTCTYSPAMHAKVVAQVQRGATPEQIVQWFVAQPEYGEKVLMAPAARGFNLMGYLVPGLTVTAVGLVLAAWLVRRRPTIEPPDGGGRGAPHAGGSSPDAEQMARLQRALDDVES
jgi:cytochrome c-type biogenesis protein CcmH